MKRVLAVGCAFLVLLAGAPAAQAASDPSPALAKEQAAADAWEIQSVSRSQITDIDVPGPDLTVGEKRVVTSADGTTTTYVQVAAACTESVSAGRPYKSGSQARGEVSFSRSAGCAGTINYRVKAYLQNEACGLGGCNWRVESESYFFDLLPGGSVSFGLAAPCANSVNRNWRTRAVHGGSGETYSPAVSLACSA